MSSISEINTSDKAKRTIRTIAKNNGIDFELAYYILSFRWNYDGPEGNWVGDLPMDQEYRKRFGFVCDKLEIPDEKLGKQELVSGLYEKLNQSDAGSLAEKFLFGSVSKNYCFVSEYASFHYLNNCDLKKLSTLDWKGPEYRRDTIIKNLFLKIFRGGSVDRYNLEYLYTDLVVGMPYTTYPANAADWTGKFIEDIENAKEKIGLSDIRTMLKKYCKGDKFFLQTVLEALSYAGILKVEGHAVKDIFIPDFRNELSAQFYANEWTYPLRFWK